MQFSIIIPTKNEAENLKILFPVILDLYPFAEILVIDASSTDGTGEVCKNFGVKFITQCSIGKGAALREAVECVSCEAIIFFDADCSHDPSDIERIIRPVIARDFKHVSGSRMLGGSSELFEDPKHFLRLLGSLFINYLISYKFKFKITDAQNGLRAFNRNYYRNLKTTSLHTTIEQECVGLTLSDGEPLLELPSHEYSRVHGISKISLMRHGLSYVISLIKIMLMPRREIREGNSSRYPYVWWKS
jgi:glycosyltransferase involved in cell wall biosynthesis